MVTTEKPTSFYVPPQGYSLVVMRLTAPGWAHTTVQLGERFRPADSVCGRHAATGGQGIAGPPVVEPKPL